MGARDRSARRGVQACLVLVTGVAVLLLAMTAGGFSTIAFTSGSMEPTIAEGSVALTRTVDAADVRPGDVVSVTSPDGERVTHRVVAAEELPGTTALTLRGDASSAADPAPYHVASADRVIASAPYLGRLAGHGWSVLAAAGGLVMVTVLGRRRLVRRPRHRRAVGPTGARAAAAGLAVLGSGGIAVVTATPTSAYWTDVAPGTTGSFSTMATIPPPSNVGCTVDESHVDLTWTNAGQRFDYRATLHTADGTQVGSLSSPPYAGEPESTTQVTRHVRVGDFGIAAADLPFPAEPNYVVRVHAQAFGSTATADRWLSDGFAAFPIHVESVSGTGAQLRCGHDVDTAVQITGIGSDTGASGTDMVTNVAANTVVGTGEPSATVVLTRGGTTIGTATVGQDGTWSASVTLTEGAFPITATATDRLGHTATDTETVHLDTTAPTVTPSSTCPSVGNAVAGVPGATWCKVTSQTWTATYADEAGGSGLVAGSGSQYNDNGAGWTSYTGAVSMAELNGRVMQARATDVAGNSTTVSHTYYIDGTAPTVTIPNPQGGLLASALVALLGTNCGTGLIACGTVTDAVSGPTLVEWQMERTALLWGTRCFNGSSYVSGTCTAWLPANRTGNQWSISGSPGDAYPLSVAASYVIRIRATDAAGNVSTTVKNFSTVG